MQHHRPVLALLLILILPCSIVRAADTYYGADVQVDTLGDLALVFGEVTVRHGGRIMRIPLDARFLDDSSVVVPSLDLLHPGAPEKSSDLHPGAPEKSLDLHPGAPEKSPELHPGAPEGSNEAMLEDLRYLRSESFALATGATVSAAVYLMSDPRSLANIAAFPGEITFDVAVIDSTTEEILIPMYMVTFGGGEPFVALPSELPAFHYGGPAIAAACVAMAVHVDDAGAARAGVEGIVVYSDNGDGLAKQESRGATLVPPPVSLTISPNPTTAYAEFTYDISTQGAVRILVYDMLGRMIATPVDRIESAGRHVTTINVAGLTTGLYRVAVEIDGKFSHEGRMAVQR